MSINDASIYANNKRDKDSKPSKNARNRVDTFENLDDVSGEDVGNGDADVHDCEVDDSVDSDRQARKRPNDQPPQDNRGYGGKTNNNDLQIRKNSQVSGAGKR